MIKTLAFHAGFAACAYSQAGWCQALAERFGFSTGLLGLFLTMLANQLVAAWITGRD